MLAVLLLFLILAILVFLPFNWITYRQLVAIHPRRKRWIVAAVIAGNLMWPVFPMLRSYAQFSRAARAIFGPLWFGWTSFAILYAALLFLVLLAWIPFRERTVFTKFARWPSRVFLSIVLVGSAIGYYQAIVPLRVERVTVQLPELPPAADGMRIALLADLHVGLFSRPSRLEQIFATANAARPDVVLIAGDLIDDDPHFIPKLLDGTRPLAPSIPLLAVFGNHEMYGRPHEVIEKLRGSRIRLLINEGFPLRDTWIAGVSDPAAGEAQDDLRLLPDLAKALAAKPAHATPIVLAHQPKILDDARHRRIPLALCAHTHGGQMGIRPLGWSLAGVFLPYDMGLYDIPPTQLYINTGTGYWLLPFRLGMEPEITVIELRSRKVAKSQGRKDASPL